MHIMQQMWLKYKENVPKKPQKHIVYFFGTIHYCDYK